MSVSAICQIKNITRTDKVDSLLLSVTWEMLTSSYNGETVQSKGYHTLYCVSWFVTMRIVDWTVCKHKVALAALLLYFIMSGIHPAAVKCPVSVSLVGRSSHVKLSVRSITRSILRCRNLRQRNQTFMSGSLNVGKHSKSIKELWISCCEILSN
jgi:hypothetical protein